MNINEVAKFAKIGVSNIRFYQKNQLIPIIENNDYSDGIAIKVKKIAILRSIGLSFQDVKDVVLGKFTLVAVCNDRLAKMNFDNIGESDISKKYLDYIVGKNLSFDDFDSTKAVYDIGCEIDVAPNDEDSLVNCPHPFERGMAASVDRLFVCFFSVFIFIYLLRFKTWYSIPVIVLVIAVLAIFAIPTVLAVTGTTFGNLIFGLKIRSFTGEKLTVKHAIDRSLISSGWSKELEDLDSKKQYYSWGGNKRIIKSGGVLPWDNSCEITMSKTNTWRKVTAVTLVVLMLVTLISSLFMSNMPRNFGDLTVAEFTENYNTMIKSRDYQNDDTYDLPVAVYVDESGNFADSIAPVKDTYFHFPMVIEEVDGVVNKVEISCSVVNSALSSEDDSGIIVIRNKQEELVFDALVAPSEGFFSFFGMSSNDNLGEIYNLNENYSLTFGDWKVTNNVELIGIEDDDVLNLNDSSFVIVQAGGEYNYTFTVEKIS